MSSIEQLGIDPESFKWEDLAACAGMKTKLFYEAYESNETVANNIDRMCNLCPVQKPCAQTGQQKEEGVWGGIYWNGRGSPDKQRNKHKDDQQWTLLEKKTGLKLRK